MSSDPNRSRSRKGGKRKIGRSARSPAHSRYNMEKRWITNKEKKAKKHQKMLDKKAARKAAKIG